MVDWKYDYLVEQIHRSAYKKHENYVIGALLHDESLSELKPCSQYYVRHSDGGYALLDLYYPQIKLAVEIDEPHHLNNTGEDVKRQRIVEGNLNCEFIRIDIDNKNVPEQIYSLKARIKNKISQFKNEGKFKAWTEPRTLDINSAKSDFKNTLFLKIKGEIHPDELMSRQTGYWRIAKDKRERIKQVIVVHNSVVSRIFTNIKWHIWNENPQKVGYKGREDDDGYLIGTKIENWTWQQTVTYSDDVY